MLETLTRVPPDPILGVSAAFQADPSPEKVDLGVGVYKDEQGKTPVPRAVRTAEQEVYAAPGATILVSDPTWANHIPLLGTVGLKVDRYPYYDAQNPGVLFERMLAHLDAQPAGTIVVLHACCHNPTGQDLSAAQWAEVAAVVARRGLMPFMDLAYQGLGEDLDRDAASVRLMARAVPEMLVAVSCSKNFGIYRERTGLLIALSGNVERAGITTGHLGRLARTLWSMPPDHGAALVERVLSQPALRQEWMTELSHMASRINSLRGLLAERLGAVSGDDYRWIGAQRGMFSRLPLSATQVAFARDHHHLYMPPDGRINIAGVSPANVDRVAAGLIAAVRS
ncbi:MAG: aspartate/tyrosine/aromatic aminotransferase [Gammaproteobacteria bacterium]|nr:aspartate/tyrosine/aromatic aminotransferase [Gammaproteobacteria bacterium]